MKINAKKFKSTISPPNPLLNPAIKENQGEILPKTQIVLNDQPVIAAKSEISFI